MAIGNAIHTKTDYVGGSYNVDPLTEYAQSFLDVTKSINEMTGLDIFSEAGKVLRRSSSDDALKNFFTENFMDEDLNDPLNKIPGYLEDQYAMQEQLYENDKNGILNESANLAAYNPVIGITFPVHKNILMNMVYDKGAIQKVVAQGPKFTISMERRILVDIHGNEIDMFTEQNKMTPAIDASNPTYEIEITLPEMGATDVLGLCGGTRLDHLSIRTHVSRIMIDKVYIKEGDIMPDEDNVIRPSGPIATASDEGEKSNVWFPTTIQFKPGYNQYERTFNQPVQLVVRSSATEIVEIKDSLSGSMDHDKFVITSASGAVKKVMLSAELDTSNAMLDTCSVTWKVDTTLVEIPNAIPLNVTISPEEVKDLAALYQVNQLTKIMGLLKTTLANYKDDKIRQFLDHSYDNLPEVARGYAEFDFAVPAGYALDPLTWRHTMFFDTFDSMVTKMLQVLNDPNMIVTVFGDPDLVRRITPTEYSYTTPSSIGPVELDFTRTVVTSDKRVYQFIGSDKLRGTDYFTVILCPRGTDRITYRIYDYQMYVSNEIRNINNPALPAVHAFERFLVDEYQPVQSRIKILNPTGFRPATSNP